MRKNLFIGAVALIVAASAGAYFTQYRTDKKEYFTVTQLANIDALVQTEGEEGTPVESCKLHGSFSGDWGFFNFCDSRTSEKMIYPCIAGISYGLANGNSMCTK